MHGETFSSLPDIELFGFNGTDSCTEHAYSAFAADIDNDNYNEVMLGCKDAEPSGGLTAQAAYKSLTRGTLQTVPDSGKHHSAA